jgi:hypothetical protein
MTVARELVSYKLNLVGLQEVGKRSRGLYFFGVERGGKIN